MHPTAYPRVAAIVLALAAASLASMPAAAQSVEAARSAARKALQGNPEVTARLNAYLGKVDAQKVASAGYMPRLDLNADVGSTNSGYRGLPTAKVSSAGAGLTLTQVLWDGMATRNDVSRASHERLSRWFELVDVAEQTALDATRAVYDVQRMRKLVALAEDNLRQHEQAAAKLDSRVKAGVGRGVDLDQARARVALAESNRDTELANLHDVAARYQRIVGETPVADMGAAELLRTGVPSSAEETVQMALSRSPAIAAGIESLRAARATEAARRSAYHPTVSATAQIEAGRNLGGVDGRKSDASVGLVLNWNLFNGGADSARLSEQQRAVAQARDLRDKACRDVRQTALVAYNDAIKLNTQLNTLGRNSAAIERARDAYRQQFDIGQRSLLDLLNAENEAYTARRALTNAVYDRALAYARTLAATNQLTTQLGISRDLFPVEDANWSAGSDGVSRCAAQAIDVTPLRSGADLAQPMAVAPTAEPAVRASALPSPSAMLPQPSGITPLPGPGAMASPAMARLDSPRHTGGSAVSEVTAATLSNRVQAWARSMRKRDARAAAAFYAPTYQGDSPSAAAWRSQQARSLAGSGALDLNIEDVTVRGQSDGTVETRFLQSTNTRAGIDVQNTALVWRQIRGQWHIVGERKL